MRIQAAVGAFAATLFCLALRSQGPVPVKSWTEDLPGGYVTVHVQNRSSHAMTAAAVLGTRLLGETDQGDRSVRFFDSVLAGHARRAVAFGKEVDFTLFGPHPSPQEASRRVEVKAALFDDGESWGDPQWVAVLLKRRAYARTQALYALSEIASARDSGETRDQILQRLQDDRARAIQAGRDINEKQMAGGVFANVLLFISRGARPDGSAIPISESLSQAADAMSALSGRIERSSHTAARGVAAP